MATLKGAIVAFNTINEMKPKGIDTELSVIRAYLVSQQGVESRRGTSFEYLDREAAVVERLREQGL